MKAVIVKDSEFKTIGLKVSTEKDSRKFAWGVCPMDCYWVKAVDMREYEDTILDLIATSNRLSEARDAVSKFTNVVHTIDGFDKNYAGGFSFDAKEYDQNVKQLEARIEKLVMSIK